MGGEKEACKLSGGVTLGSPPRGRGKAGFLRAAPGYSGITPAWAGKRDSAPPPAAFCHGITPAWAGKSLCSRWPASAAQDHPRVGGEKSAVTKQKLADYGSPPRGRGKVGDLIGGGYVAGITPAWAGKSPRRAEGQHQARDHPRVGGEKWLPPAERSGPLGSPPRGRGKVTTAMKRKSPIGITPAWAGKSC